MTGYSGTPLVKKLGIKAGHRVGVLGDPGHFEELLRPLPDGAHVVRNPRRGCEVVVAFAPNRSQFVARLDRTVGHMPADGSLWIAWPKRASGVPTDMTENVVREEAFPRHLVDVKVCAIDDTWSGLKLMVRKERRSSWPTQ
ncbi:MAG: DUF3052 domain-containing protein [Actinomycetota bacterium]